MRITSLQQQKRRRDRVSIFLDEEFWVGISERLCTELGLSAGMEISPEQKKEIEEAALEDGALQYAFDRLSTKLLPKAKLEQKLLDRDYSPGTVQDVLRRCEELSLLDDPLWADTVSEERALRGQGRRKVEVVLRQNKIAEETIESVLERHFPENEEQASADQVLQDRFRVPLDPPSQRRAYQMLRRRGFSSSAATASVDRYSMKPEEAEEAWGEEEALLLLRRRFSKEDSRQKLYDFLRRRSFSPEAIRKSLESFYS